MPDESRQTHEQPDMTPREPAVPDRSEPEVKPPSVTSSVLLAAALFVFIQTFSLLSPILLSVLLILLISLAVNPMISRVRAWTGGRKRATGLFTAALVVLIGSTGWAAFVPIKASVTKLADHLPAYWERLQKPLIRMEQQAARSEEKLQAEVSTEIARNAPAVTEPEGAPRAPEPAPPEPAKDSESLRSTLGRALQGAVGGFTEVAFNATQVLVVLVTVFFGVTFTLMNPRPVFGSIFSLVPERHHDRGLIIARRIGEFVPGWAGSTLLGMLSIGLLVFLIMWPIFGLMDALVLGLIAGVLEAIPFLGPILAAGPGLLLAVGEGGMTPVWVLLAYLAIQAVENNVVLPLIMARGMKLHPLAVILSMLFCVAAFGVLGVLVAAPVVAIVAILHEELYRKRFLPSVTDADLERLARQALHEKVSEDKTG